MNSALGTASRALDSGSYSDLNRLNQLKVGPDRDGEENVRKVAQEFESLFMNEMLKSMRAATDVIAKDNPFNSQASKQYQDMYDQQLSVSLSKEGGGIGLADVLVRQLSKQKEAESRPNPFAQVQDTQAAAWPKKPQAALDAPVRDDSKLLNQRRLALPGKLAERQVANVDGIRQADAAGTPATPGQPLVNLDWKPAQAFPAPVEKQLVVNGIDPTAPSAPAKTRFESPAEFIATMLPMAEKAAKRLGVEARYLVAQAALETGWGKSMIRQKDGSNSHNLFGIKSTGWSGESAQVMTTEYVNGQARKERAGFRAYDSFEQSFNDFVNLLENNDRYRGALQVASNGGDSAQFVRELQRAGYATDPQYANKINQIARKVQAYETIAAADTAPTTRARG
ncbi:flagellar assembly peptidoglycan hydrolase FlgJ [Stutzerimonas urumqiensis]|uniref:flagellar assembly peptidoglycan hydrolase FlgJ n=1 Tax=Stutzerimonas urumqiensis TaxID=638269 RepID=UPI003DA5123D